LAKYMGKFPPELSEYHKISKVIKRSGKIVSFDRNKITDSIFRAALEVGGENRERAERLTDEVVKLINNTYHPDSPVTIEDIQDLVEKVLVENGHYRTAKAYILYRAEHARLREHKEMQIQIDDNVPYKVLWRVYTWNVDHGCDTVENLNRTINEGKFARLVGDAEQAYHQEIERVAERILERRDKIRLIIVAGPSCSGKTTTTTKIGEALKNHGIVFSLVNVDNYFLPLDQQPKDEYGDYDFETPQALDLRLINEHLYRLVIKREEIQMPCYDFKTGGRKKETVSLRLKNNEILLIDSLHGLYPEMTVSLPQGTKFKFYIEALCQIKNAGGEFVRWADLRMLRRMVRDSWNRAYNPEKTVGHWHYVRRSEKTHIVPFINKADYVFNGALPYELSIYKKFLSSCLPAIVEKYELDSRKTDAFIRARRVYELLKSLKEGDVSVIPHNSLLREFIGGSSYKY